VGGKGEREVGIRATRYYRVLKSPRVQQDSRIPTKTKRDRPQRGHRRAVLLSAAVAPPSRFSIHPSTLRPLDHLSERRKCVFQPQRRSDISRGYISGTIWVHLASQRRPAQQSDDIIAPWVYPGPGSPDRFPPARDREDREESRSLRSEVRADRRQAEAAP